MMTGMTVETLCACFFFTLAFLFGPKVHKPDNIRRRSLFSFSAGASVAYIFVHLSPELAVARKVFLTETAPAAAHLNWYAVPVATMLGFVVFYGLDQFCMGLKPDKERPHADNEAGGDAAFWLHTSTFGVYAWLVSYLLVDNLEEGSVSIGLYALAMGMHFLTVSHGLHKEYGLLYDRKGARLLAIGCLAGWTSGMLIDFPRPVIAILLSLVAGGVIVNTLIGELPKEKEGRFIPFVLGAFCYTGLLLLSA